MTIYTKLEQLPERFALVAPMSKQMTKYVEQRWKRTSYGHWRKVKPIAYNPEFRRTEQRWGKEVQVGNALRWVENISSSYSGCLRFVGKVDEITNTDRQEQEYFSRPLVDHNGWYDNNYSESTRSGDGLIWGEVYQLPGRNGQPLYVPAYRSGSDSTEGAVLDFHAVTSDLADAIRSADSMAERTAEAEREYRATEDAKQRIEEIDAEIKEERSAVLRLIRELRSNCSRLSGLTEVRRTIREHIETVRERCDELAKERTRVEQEGVSY
jgi:hypothetical protein